jgi:hypothetical protein
MSTLLTMPRAVGPTLSYIFHGLETAWFDGSPVQIIVDEAKWLLDNAQFLGEAEICPAYGGRKSTMVQLQAFSVSFKGGCDTKLHD